MSVREEKGGEIRPGRVMDNQKPRGQNLFLAKKPKKYTVFAISVISENGIHWLAKDLKMV